MNIWTQCFLHFCSARARKKNPYRGTYEQYLIEWYIDFNND
jgi:hypothetical protein